MRSFIWWLRATFCTHEWKLLHNTSVYAVNCRGERLGSLPHLRVRVKECTKCGWVWRQET